MLIGRMICGFEVSTILGKMRNFHFKLCTENLLHDFLLVLEISFHGSHLSGEPDYDIGNDC